MTNNALDISALVAETSELPCCALCLVPVRSLYVDFDPLDGLIFFVALCHGEDDVVQLTTDEWAGMYYATIKFGWAFGLPVQEAGHWPIDFGEIEPL